MNVEPVNIEPARQNFAWIRRVDLGVNDPAPFATSAIFWRTVVQAATIGMFAIALGFVLYAMHSLLVPMISAIIVGMTVGPLVRQAKKIGIPDWLSAIVIVLVLIAVFYLAIISLSQPAAELMARSSEIGTAVKDKFTILDRPIAALRELKSVLPGSGSSLTVAADETNMLASAVVFITPAVGQVVVFFGFLFFFILGRTAFRSTIINFFESRDGRLRSLKILNDIERNLSGYLLTVTAINLVVGLVTAAGSFALGLPSPLLWGAFAFALNYIPYVGPAIMAFILLAIGLLTFPTLLSSLIPVALFVAFTTVEGHFITPNIIGRRLLLHPLAVFSTLAFWTWLWGPVGAFLSMPILIVILVCARHLYPKSDQVIPG